MGVYIKGMKMPEKCEDCRFWDGNNNGCMVMHMITLRRTHQKKPSWCHLVEVPDHGDLIDAHSLKIRLGQRFCLDNRRVMEIVRETVDTAKVVIPEERSEK